MTPGLQLRFDFSPLEARRAEARQASDRAGMSICSAPCAKCRGLGSFEGPLPQLNLEMSLQEIWQITKACRIPCERCGGSGKARKLKPASTAGSCRPVKSGWKVLRAGDGSRMARQG